MKAIVCTKYGAPDVLQFREIEKPVPRDNEVLIKVCASTVTAADYRVRGFDVPVEFWLPARIAMGLIRPKHSILGTELAGEIIAVGKAVSIYKEGDQVFGLDGSRFGGYAEYTCRPEDGVLTIKPTNLSCEEAAAIPFGAHTALYFLRDMGNIQSGQKVLIYGASGGVGTAAVQLARYFGAKVTGVCSTTNLELVKSLHADEVIDYTKEDFTHNGETYDIIFDTVGRTSFSRCKNSLTQNGHYLLTAFRLPQLMQMLWTSMTGGKRVICAVTPERKNDLMFIKKLVESGNLKPVIDKHYPLEETADAHRYAEKGHKKGSVVITLAQNDE